MRPPARATRSARTDSGEPSARPLKPSSNRSSRTGTPYSDKEKKPRHRMTDEQLERLEVLYQLDTHPTREQKQALADEVGMDTRTVTVWFQNRRQLSKKNSQIVTAAAQPLMSRRPLGAVSHSNSQVSSRQLSVASSTSHGSVYDRNTPQPALKRELWEYLPSSPSAASSRPVSAATSAMPSPLRKKFSVIRGSGKENIAPDSRKRKPILEWACARVAKRQRKDLDEIEEQDEPVGILDEDDGDVSESTIVDVGLPTDKPEKLSVTYPTAAKLTTIAIPKKYQDKFAPDVVFGASLLLAFQYSVKPSTRAL
ncbi:hypothetical protein PHLGIDRAFT_310816 [Phlebiopsis gigantea 11061_1 CR5-6]|uniref:Homeobox domain-containing protein n=1 Tax=Phlebiopsis gigantea (strain 11061_1 CR5-6) TaxID=745531 RepID=A0A0C3NC59_PHLG1|nr:hypothetical protein PHLGIDRAFT_310816 [Phlebiopsis gigantea 11061_1 CR5-6]